MGDSNEGRLGNVAGVVVAADASVASVRDARGLLMRICEQVVVVDEPRASSLGRVVAGLQAVEAERVLVVDASRELPAPEFVLALTAWPESPAVVPEMDSPACAIYVREAVLPDARARLESGETGLADWHSGCDACVLDAATLAAISEADG